MAKKIQYNQAISQSFKLVIPGFEQLNYFVQNTELPGMTMNAIRNDYRNHQGNLQNNKIDYDILNVTFIVDEDLENHALIHEWFKRMQTGKSNLIKDEMMDINLHLLTSNKTPGKIATFYGAFPVMLSGLPLETAVSDTMPLVCTASFAYQYYELKPAIL